jgi:hypothetical protein
LQCVELRVPDDLPALAGFGRPRGERGTVVDQRHGRLEPAKYKVKFESGGTRWVAGCSLLFMGLPIWFEDLSKACDEHRLHRLHRDKVAPPRGAPGSLPHDLFDTLAI